MKGSDLVLGKFDFTEYVPTMEVVLLTTPSFPVYRAHLKIHFSVLYVSVPLVVVVPSHVGFRGALNHPMQVVSRENSPMHVKVHGNLVVIHEFVLYNASVNITS